MIIKFSNEDFKKCEEFANKIDTSYYATRNQFNQKKKIKDQQIGKLGELAVFSFFQEKKIKLTAPDFNLYDKTKKSWDFDLKNNEINLHVKSQDVKQGAKYGTSWIFQQGDKKIFKDYSEIDWVSFVSVDLEKKHATIQAIIRLDDLHKSNIFKEPQLEYLKNNKKAIYLTDLQKIFKKPIQL